MLALAQRVDQELLRRSCRRQRCDQGDVSLVGRLRQRARSRWQTGLVRGGRIFEASFSDGNLDDFDAPGGVGAEITNWQGGPARRWPPDACRDWWVRAALEPLYVYL